MILYLSQDSGRTFYDKVNLRISEIGAMTLGSLALKWDALPQHWRDLFAIIEHETQSGIPDALLKRYGRHDMHCPSTGPCICGFGEIEKRWK